MNKAKIKKYFKTLLKEELGGRFKYITKPLKWSTSDFIFIENEIYIRLDYFGFELRYNCNNGMVPIPRLGQYREIVVPLLNPEDKSYSWFNCNTFKKSEYYVINSEEDLKNKFFNEILPALNNIHCPRGARINTIADCFQLKMSDVFWGDVEHINYHLLYAKLITPSKAAHIETVLREVALPELGIQNHNNPRFYLEDDEYGTIFKNLCNLNQEEELESGRLLESDLVVTTRNEEWRSLDPEFEERISPEYKELLYGK